MIVLGADFGLPNWMIPTRCASALTPVCDNENTDSFAGGLCGAMQSLYELA